MASSYSRNKKNIENEKIPKTLKDWENHESKFWSDQPMMHAMFKPHKEQYIYDPSDDIESPYNFEIYTHLIPDASGGKFIFNKYEFSKLSNDDVDKMVTFINKNYFENFDSKQRLYHSSDYIRWLKPNMVVTVSDNNNDLSGIVFSRIIKIQHNDKVEECPEIFFMCIKKLLRRKNDIAKKMIQNLCNIYKDKYKCSYFATYRYIGKPIVSLSVYSRILNFNKLYKSEYIKINDNDPVKLDSIKKKSEIFDKNSDKFKLVSIDDTVYKTTEDIPNFDPTIYPKIYQLYNDYRDKYNIYEYLTYEDFIDKYITNNLVTTFIILNDKKEPNDFASYIKTQTVMRNGSVINKATLLFYTSLTSQVTPFRIMKNAIIYAKKENIDIFVTLDSLENHSILNDLKFEDTKMKLHYYAFNKECFPMINEQIGKHLIY